jgi:hypothetical protein
VWKRLCGHYAVETVNTVVDETQRGDITRREYVVVDKAMLLRTLASVVTALCLSSGSSRTRERRPKRSANCRITIERHG